MRSALVQGFASPELYGAQTRELIVAEVEQAKSLGFNTLRLHIKAFEPTYLDVCDELGMFVHSDIPVAEPIAHDELGIETTLTRRAFAATRAQVRRDRNHPSIILWSATNELGIEKPEARGSELYTEFMRAIVALIEADDSTRPVIENDWIEPDPERVTASPVLTAHWYGRLDQRYLAKLDAHATRAGELTRPLFVTELGDWGLPTTDVYESELRALGFAEPPLVSELAATPWPASYADFATGTQTYQGLSDRLQVEILRRHGLGYGLTELTDVPYELNGVLDLARREKPNTAVEIRRANQPVLPMLVVGAYCFGARNRIEASLSIANDGPELRDVTLTVRLDDFAAVRQLDFVPDYAVTSVGDIELPVPHALGAHQCLLELHVDGLLVGANRYPIHVVAATTTQVAVSALVVEEGTLDAAAGVEIGARLARGETVLLLAQEPAAAHHLPFEATLAWLGTGWDDSDDAGWGSSAYRFTTDADWLRSLPAATVLSYEDTTVPPRCLFTSIDDRPWPDTTAVGVYKPAPNPIQGTLIGEVTVGGGRLLFCQLPVAAAAAAGDAFALALLGDLLRLLARTGE
jgi:hypothetical protein